MKTIQLTNTDDEFYPRMGPFLANRTVIKAIGYPLYDDDGKVWHLALDDGLVVGFCYAWQRPSKLDVGSFYAMHEHAAAALAKSVIAHMQPGTAVIVTKSETVVRGAKKAGFKGRLPKGKFTHLEHTKA